MASQAAFAVPATHTAPVTTHSRPSKKTKLDYSLPSDFQVVLDQPFQQALDVLIPLQLFEIKQVNEAKPSETKDDIPPFLQAMRKIPDAQTENGALAYSTTDSPLTDLFYEFTPGVQADRLFELLAAAWEKDNISTLRIIFHARSIHEGKGYKEGFFRAMAWLYENHPRTMLANLHLSVDPTCERHRSKTRDASNPKLLATHPVEDTEVLVMEENAGKEIEAQEYPVRPHGCYKDLVDLLILAVNDQLSTKWTGDLFALNEAIAPKAQAKHFLAQRIGGGSIKKSLNSAHTHLRAINKAAKIRLLASGSEESVINDAKDFQREISETSHKGFKHKKLKERLSERLTKDPKFQALYAAVVDLFVEAIRKDLQLLEEHKQFLQPSAEAPHKSKSSEHQWHLSYAAKWTPTPAHSADRQLLLSSAIGNKLFPDSEVALARQRLQSEVLTPLRAVLKVPEVEMKQGLWKIDYKKVPARAMARNAKHFMLHDPSGYEKYLEKVAAGRATIAGASMFPHELLMDAVGHDALAQRLANLQWKSMVESIASTSKAKLSNCLAIADVSGSMGSFHWPTNKKHPEPIAVCISLTLLLGELADGPWKGHFFTFSSNPTFEAIDLTTSLSERASALHQAHWHQSTAFYKVFDLILEVAKREKLAKEDMIQKLFVFSDMQFDEATSQNSFGETEHQHIQRKFDEAGYELPELVYWNLASREYGIQPTNKPVHSDVEGVSLVSGYSGMLLKYFLGLADAKEEEEREEAAEDDFVEVEDGGAGGEPTIVVKSTKEKKKPNPMETVNAIIGAKSFAEVVVVD